jgi:uncharacterized membrane protein YphA (DoxX/SURF4 family)
VAPALPAMSRFARSSKLYEESTMPTGNYLLMIGRLFMSRLFIWKGFVQLHNYVASAKYLASVNVCLVVRKALGAHSNYATTLSYCGM